MKQLTDALIASDKKLQQFLIWVNKKSLSVRVPYKPAAVRAFYFSLDRVLDPALERALDPALERTPDLAPDLALDRTLDRALKLALDLALYKRGELVDTVLFALNLAVDCNLRQALQKMTTQLPDTYGTEEKFMQWWHAKGQGWTRQLRKIRISHRNIGHDWHFSDQQKKVLRQYYDANLLLVDCLNSSCNVTPAVRQEIEETLLLPIAEIQKHR
jgi:predicted NACHT family NTPase